MLVNCPRLSDALAITFGVKTTQPTSPIHRTVLQRGHGFVTVGTSIEQATDYAYCAASNARVEASALLQNKAAGGGGAKYVSAQERKRTANMNAWFLLYSWCRRVNEVERSGMFVTELGTPPDPSGGS